MQYGYAPTITRHEALMFLMEYYGMQRFTALTGHQQIAMASDVIGIAGEETLPLRQAIQTLDRRIWNKLESYAATLVAGKSL